MPAQSPPPPVISSDVEHFWQAYDAVQQTSDLTLQADALNRLFFGRGTAGLRAFMEAKGYTPAQYLEAIHEYPKFWASVRPRSALAQDKVAAFGPMIEKFRALYPRLRPATIYFEIGCLRSGGTTLDDKVLIGTELITANDSTDTSEFPPAMRARLATYFHSDPLSSLVLTDIHEYVHTQQKPAGDTLLAYALREGAAELVAEQVVGSKLNLPLYTYGPAHREEILNKFRQDMGGSSIRNWLYNSADNQFGTSDLGYYVGYLFWSDYLSKAKDKSAAIATMIELNYADTDAVQSFAASTRFFSLS